jgi:hypothetical protein
MPSFQQNGKSLTAKPVRIAPVIKQRAIFHDADVEPVDNNAEMS